jgi:ribosomal protein S18 acetylase RimI-like enzyme
MRAPAAVVPSRSREYARPVTNPRSTIRLLGTSDAELYRELRLEALRLHPYAYGSTFEAEAAEPVAHFERRLASSDLLLGSVDTGPMGIARLTIPSFATERHKGMLTGMYVRASARGSGLASALVDAIVERARGRVALIELSVVTTNERAYRLYRRHGFEIYGVDPCALKHGDRYLDEYRMVRLLEPPPGWTVPRPPSVAWR